MQIIINLNLLVTLLLCYTFRCFMVKCIEVNLIIIIVVIKIKSLNDFIGSNVSPATVAFTFRNKTKREKKENLSSQKFHIVML